MVATASNCIHLHPIASRRVDAKSTGTASSVAVMEPKLNTMVPSPAIPRIEETKELSQHTDLSINQSSIGSEEVDALLQPTTAEEEISENWMQITEDVDISTTSASTNLDAIGCNWMQLDKDRIVTTLGECAIAPTWMSRYNFLSNYLSCEAIALNRRPRL